MNYSKNDKKSYGRKVVRENKRKGFVAWCILCVLGFLIGMVFVSGIMHLMFCGKVAKASVVNVLEVKMIEEPKVEEPKTEVTEEPKVKAEVKVATTSIPQEVVEEPKVEVTAINVPEEPEIQQISLGTYKLTAYCACSRCCGKTNGITASGAKAVQGVTVAADTRILPFGTKIYIDGYGERTVQDTGGAIKGNRIDVFFDSHQEALQFGVQYKEIFMMKEGEQNGQL